jgi:single-stranded-DNA-specific exonuclease
LFTRYGGHAHAVGFALPAERVPQLRAFMDAHARQRLVPSDFEPVLEIDSELDLTQVTPDLFEALCRLEPFGMGNREPVFVARNVRLLLPPRILKEKHIKLKLAPPSEGKRFQRGISAMGWRMAERFQQEQVLAGDSLDVAFTLTHNDHPDFGGVELCLVDVARVQAVAGAGA